jgi:hypothetical protein
LAYAIWRRPTDGPQALIAQRDALHVRVPTYRDDLLVVVDRVNENAVIVDDSAVGKTCQTDVAREAGVSRQAVYLHFSSRASLFVAVVRHMDEQEDIRRRREQALGNDDRWRRWKRS